MVFPHVVLLEVARYFVLKIKAKPGHELVQKMTKYYKGFVILTAGYLDKSQLTRQMKIFYMYKVLAWPHQKMGEKHGKDISMLGAIIMECG